MTDSSIKQEIAEQLDRLPPELQRRVLDFTQALILSLPKGVSGKELIRFAGILEAEDAQAIAQAIKPDVNENIVNNDRHLTSVSTKHSFNERRAAVRKLCLVFIPVFLLTGIAKADYLSFDGIDDYVAIPDAPRLSGGIGRSLSVEAWVYPTSYDARHIITKYLGWNDKDWGMTMEADGTIKFIQEGGTGCGRPQSVESIPLNAWSHVAFVCDNPNDIVNIYINGVFAGSGIPGAFGDLIDTNAAVWIGAPGEFYYNYYNQGRPGMFFGYIDEVRIWDVPRTEDDIHSNMLAGSITGNEDGLVAYFDFEKGEDLDTLYDRTGDSHHGYIYSATWQDGNAPIIPEPSTILLLTTGLCGIAAYGLRKKRKA